MNMASQAADKPLYPYVDCLRGYAVTLVITCHLRYSFPGLPYPIGRLASFGWHGVQLFFLASCLTLLMSRRNEAAASPSILAFYLRRFLRIAPMYYCAVALYLVLRPPADGIDPGHMLAWMLFANGWDPVTMATTPGWTVVPGGWSIGVEFSFYLVFPAIASVVTSLRRSVVFLGLAALGGAAANHILWPYLSARFGSSAADNFLYFWLPNQFAVFALGAVVFYLNRSVPLPLKLIIERHSQVALPVLTAATAALAYLPAPHWLDLRPAVPTFLAASLMFAAFSLVLAHAEPGLFLNPLARAMGKVSFSAYLLHFAVLDLLPTAHPSWFGTAASGWRAIPWFFGSWLVVVAVTYCLSWCTHQLVERPFIALGKRALSRPIPTVAAAPLRAAAATKGNTP